MAARTEQTNTRERILAAARALFAEQGYAAASTAKIAKKAGVLPGSLYWAFESKEALFAEVLTASAEEWKQRFVPDADRPPGRIADFRRDLLRFSEGFAEGPEFLRLIMVVATEHQGGSPEIRGAAVAVRRMWRDALEAMLIAQLADYEPRAVKALAQRFGRLVLQLLDGVFLSLQIEQTELTAAELLADVGDVIDRELAFAVSRLEKA